MPPETATYLANIVIVSILAVLVTHHWLRQKHTDAMLSWMVAAWVMAAADGFFAARPELPPWIGRTVPTVLVTVGHLELYFGARRTAGLRVRYPFAVAVLLAHAAGLCGFLLFPEFVEWRKVFNGFVWAGFSLASFAVLRRAPSLYWRQVVAPANVFLLHGLFHSLRLVLAAIFVVMGSTAAAAWLQLVGDLEVSFFMVALFGGILVASLQLRNEELTQALVELDTLSELLPICAWCKKVRNDAGYWQRVEDYFASHSRVKFTHGICSDCLKKFNSAPPE